jgi:tetratricopeptide (TPR) repeat protein
VVASVLTFFPGAIFSLFMRPDLATTPVDRLIENIDKQLASEPNNSKLLLNLARTHGMAYAKKTDELEIDKRRPNEPWFGNLPPRVPYGPIVELNDEYRQKHQLDEAAIQKLEASAQNHLRQSIEWYRKALAADPENSTAELGLAWSLDQSGKTEEAIELYRKLVDQGWEQEKEMTSGKLNFQSLVAEAAGYLLKHLDAAKDKDQIDSLQAKIERVKKIRRPVTPIAIPLEATGWENVYDPDARVAFDADGSGDRKTWTWIRPQAGWLVYDHLREGKINSALQLFGGVSFWCFWDHGYQPLRALDDNQDGWLRGSEVAALAIWQDVNQNGVSDLGEVRPLIAHGIVAIDCASHESRFGDDWIRCNPQGCVRRDGSTLPSYDVILHPAEPSAAPIAKNFF